MFSYQPKGSMCAVCVHKESDCSNLDFEVMRPIMEEFKSKTNTMRVVKCEHFFKEPSTLVSKDRIND